jgi:hypothetical protein
MGLFSGLVRVYLLYLYGIFMVYSWTCSTIARVKLNVYFGVELFSNRSISFDVFRQPV